ncbi:MAG: hypothetical protein AAGK01_02890 [Pseudomonadota bacterium]
MTRRPHSNNALMNALWLNFLWINASEIVRYFFVVRPMLRAAFPGQEHIAPMGWGIFAIWGVWDLILIAAATGFFWLWLERFGYRLRQVMLGSGVFTLSVFGLLWLGIANMGLAPYSMMAVALPLAWIEQAVACWIVLWCRSRAQPSSSIRSM